MSGARQIFPKTARLEARLTDEQKTARTIREHDVLTLSGRDRQVFLDALLKPSPPNKRLRQAAKRYKRASGT